MSWNTLGQPKQQAAAHQRGEEECADTVGWVEMSVRGYLWQKDSNENKREGLQIRRGEQIVATLDKGCWICDAEGWCDTGVKWKMICCDSTWREKRFCANGTPKGKQNNFKPWLYSYFQKIPWNTSEKSLLIMSYQIKACLIAQYWASSLSFSFSLFCI